MNARLDRRDVQLFRGNRFGLLEPAVKARVRRLIRRGLLRVSAGMIREAQPNIIRSAT
jgi:hypothetical protein